MEMKVNIKRCCYELWKRKQLIGLIVIFSILVGVFMMLNVKEVGNYSATSSVYSMVYASGSEGQGEQETLSEFSEVVQSTNVAKRAADILDKDGITGDSIQYMYNTSANGGNLVYVYSFADDPDLAVNIANAVAEAFVVEYKNLTGVENIQVFERAQSAQYYRGDSTNKKMTLVIYTGVGFFLVCLVIVLRTIFSAKVQDFSECNMDGEIELLGVIPEIKGKEKRV